MSNVAILSLKKPEHTPRHETLAALVIDQEIAEIDGMTDATGRWRITGIFNTGRAFVDDMGFDGETAVSKGQEMAANYPRLRWVHDDKHKIAIDTDLCDKFETLAAGLYIPLLNKP